MWDKSQQNAIFSDFSRKNQCSHYHILSKKVHSLKNTLLLCPFFVKKRSFSKTRWSHVIFIKFSWKTRCCNSDIWSKNVNSVKTILWAIKVNRIYFLYDFHQIIPALMPKFCQKNVHSLKNHLSYAHILSKVLSFSQKQCVSCIFFFKFVRKTSCCHAHIWSKKTSILSNLHYIIGQKNK